MGVCVDSETDSMFLFVRQEAETQSKTTEDFAFFFFVEVLYFIRLVSPRSVPKAF